MKEVQIILTPNPELESPCWIWTGTKSNGYGRVWNGSKWLLAYRLSYESLMRKLEPNEELHHRCGTKLCVNPMHLEVMQGTSEHIKEHNRTIGKDDRCALHPNSRMKIRSRFIGMGRVCMQCEREKDRIRKKSYLTKPKA